MVAADLPPDQKLEVWRLQRKFARWAMVTGFQARCRLLIRVAESGNWQLAVDIYNLARACHSSFTWPLRMGKAAIAHGQVDFFRAALAWRFDVGSTTKLCNAAAKHGQFEALQVLRSLQPPALWGADTVKRVCAHGHSTIVDWLLTKGCPVDDCVAEAAAAKGDVSLLARLHGLPCDMGGAGTCAAAARHGHLEALQYLVSLDVPMDAQTPAAAAGNSHVDILKWTAENGCAADETACEGAARGGQVPALLYLANKATPARELGAPYDASTCEAAAQGGHLEVLQCLRTVDCPWDAAVCAPLVKGNSAEGLGVKRNSVKGADIKGDLVKGVGIKGKSVKGVAIKGGTRRRGWGSRGTR
ncbi:hypothetical protein JKP88DRAFT_279615 [Tribonema minus]|uniref:Uncharacterized protein n=1 Tax=Tribonema minus TaxID=303371 RepID=A0A836CCB7_9STRA|nr:hypothetical protein JKP88DRAFT_279615 [Tribonema minus]